MTTRTPSHFSITTSCRRKLVKKKFIKDRTHHVVSTWASDMDEAMALLLYENNYTRWLEMAEHNDNKEHKVMAITKYTSGKGKGGSRRYEGWTEAGRQRMNELYGMVRADCADNRGWEEEYMEEHKKKKNNKRSSTTAEEREAESSHHCDQHPLG